MAQKTFLAGLAINFHRLARYIVKHRATMDAAITTLGASAADKAAVDAALDAIVAAAHILDGLTGY